jgi:hypothetical protein
MFNKLCLIIKNKLNEQFMQSHLINQENLNLKHYLVIKIILFKFNLVKLNEIVIFSLR